MTCECNCGGHADENKLSLGMHFWSPRPGAAPQPTCGSPEAAGFTGCFTASVSEQRVWTDILVNEMKPLIVTLWALPPELAQVF